MIKHKSKISNVTITKAKKHKSYIKQKFAQRYEPDIKIGLSGDIVQQRIEQGLYNDKPVSRSKSYARIVFENVFNFCNTITLSLVILLIAINAANQAVSSCIIFINMAIGIYQEIKAKRTVEKLALVVDSYCEVVRDGITLTISTRELVLDDIFIINAGMQVPVDCELVDGIVEVDESILTGESAFIRKDFKASLLAGSHIVSGQAIARADKVGRECYIENVARIARRVTKPRSNIFNVLDKIIKGITIGLVPLALLLFISTRIAANAPINDTMIQVAGSVIGMLPVGMFLLTSTALASSVLKLSKKNTLAQDLYGVEMLAMVDTLLVDKTGTITNGMLEVKEEMSLSNEIEDIGSILMTLFSATNDNNATAIALKTKYKDGVVQNITNFTAFSSTRKYSAVEVDGEKVYCLGAPDFVVSQCQQLDDFAYRSSCCCNRSLVLARFDGKLDDMKKEDMIPLFAFSLEDKLREDVKETLDWFHQNDVDIKIVSGDNPFTVSEIALKTGVFGAENYINCYEMSDEDIDGKLEKNTVFGRVSPEQKSKIVNMLQSKGRVVGMIGDGVNDVQALREADCSISFASANEVARNISRIIMMDSNFKSLPEAVKEGRRVIGNVEKVSSLYIMKNLFVMVMTFIFAITTFIIKEDIYPFIPTRLLVLELFVIGIPTVALALQSSNRRVQGSFLRNIMKSSIPAGFSLIFGVGLVLILLAVGVIDTSAIQNVKDYNSSIACITLTMAGFSALFIIALPLNRYRLTVIFSMIALTLGCVLLDQFALNSWFFTIETISNPIHILWIGAGTALATIVNIALRYAINKVDIRWEQSSQQKTLRQQDEEYALAPKIEN